MSRHNPLLYPVYGLSDPGIGENLNEAYHAVFDIKDEAIKHSQINKGDDLAEQQADAIRVQCYNVCAAIGTLMEHLGYDVPERFDGEGR